jgi:chemotaxis protein methyltransferase WspC
VILQAHGDATGAEDAFRKALYLDPGHREALTHAMLLLSQRGEASRAAALRERLERLPPEGAS